MAVIDVNNICPPLRDAPAIVRTVDYRQQPWSRDASLVFRLASQAQFHFLVVPSKVVETRLAGTSDFELPSFVPSKVAKTRFHVIAPMEPVQFDADEFPL